MTIRLSFQYNLGVAGDRTTSAAAESVHAPRTANDSGHVSARGVIDLHSEAQTPTGLLMRVLRGVTTALVGDRRAKWDGAVGAMDDRG